jgi:hypothetical protein
MHTFAVEKKENQTDVFQHINPVQRITALWALSEAALGGALHAFQVPFTGLFIGGSAVLFISVIFFLAEKRGAILKATLLVMIVKALASPHAPINAYFAVAFQGLCGEVLFSIIKKRNLAALLLGIFSLLQSALQKIIVVTVVFGKTIWEAIDLFAQFVISEFFSILLNTEFISISLILIFIYIGIHLFGGILFGIWASRLGRTVKSEYENDNKIYQIPLKSEKKVSLKTKRRRRLWKKISLMLLFTIFLSIVILSYVYPVFEQSKGLTVLLMILRSIVIMTLWYFTVGPFLMGKLRHYLNRKETKYKAEVESIVTILPVLRRIVQKSWITSRQYKYRQRIYFFIETLLIHIVCAEIVEEPRT